MVTFEADLAVVIDFRSGHRSVSQVAHQNAGAPVHKSLGEPLVQRVAQPVLDVTGLFAPMGGVFKPVSPIGDIGPGADLANPGAEGVDVAGDVVAETHLLGNPVGRDRAVPAEVGIDARDDLAMLGRRDVAIVGQGAALPEQFHRFTPDCQIARFIP